MELRNHPFRLWVVEEMRLRRFAPVPAASELYQVLLITDAGDRAREDEHLPMMRPELAAWTHSSRAGTGNTASGIYVVWERHTEASTITVIIPDDCPAPARTTFLDWLHGFPGQVIRATRTRVIPDDADIERELDAMDIEREGMVCCDISHGMRIWSDFAVHGDGYGRLLITAGNVSENERGRVIQRVQETGNYRNMALMGFRTVQEHGPDLDRLERSLSEHAERVARSANSEEEDGLLQELASLSSQLELIRSATEFRLSATKAYADVAMDRLHALDVTPVANYQSLIDYTERRLVPAARTCAVFHARLDRIAERISRVMHTLDVQVDTRIKAQNLQLTRSMERSIQLQFRLQRLVEGLSVIAAAYYLIGLVGFLVKGASAWPGGSRADMILAAVTLPAVLLIWLIVHRLRGTMLGSDEA